MSETRRGIELNEGQRRALGWLNKAPLRVIAGPGTGKTATVVEIYLRLVEGGDLNPSQVLLLTFSRNAASELQGRVDERFRRSYGESWISTFHSFAYRIVREYSGAGVRQRHLINGFQEKLLMRSVLDSLGNRSDSAGEPKGLSGLFGTQMLAQDALWLISSLKQELVESAAFAEWVAEIHDPTGSDPGAPSLPGQQAGTNTATGDHGTLAGLEPVIDSSPAAGDYSKLGELEPPVGSSPAAGDYAKPSESEPLADSSPPASNYATSGEVERLVGHGRLAGDRAKLADLARIYTAYVREQERLGLADFRDVIAEAVTLLETNEEVRATLSHKFRYVIVDEYQDVDAAQVRLLENLTRDHPGFWHLAVVGDGNQSIYSFRGTSPAYLESGWQFGGETVRLRENYRSFAGILTAAERLGSAFGLPGARVSSSHLPADTGDGSGRAGGDAVRLGLLAGGEETGLSAEKAEVEAGGEETGLSPVRGTAVWPAVQIRHESTAEDEAANAMKVDLEAGAEETGLSAVRGTAAWPAVQIRHESTAADEAAGVARLIGQLTKPIDEGGGGYRYDDIAIVLRSVRRTGREFEDALQAAGIPRGPGGSPNFASLDIVRFAVSALQALNDPGDDEHLVRVLESPFCGVPTPDARRLLAEAQRRRRLERESLKDKSLRTVLNHVCYLMAEEDPIRWPLPWGKASADGAATSETAEQHSVEGIDGDFEADPLTLVVEPIPPPSKDSREALDRQAEIANQIERQSERDDPDRPKSPPRPFYLLLSDEAKDGIHRFCGRWGILRSVVDRVPADVLLYRVFQDLDVIGNLMREASVDLGSGVGPPRPAMEDQAAEGHLRSESVLGPASTDSDMHAQDPSTAIQGAGAEAAGQPEPVLGPAATDADIPARSPAPAVQGGTSEATWRPDGTREAGGQPEPVLGAAAGAADMDAQDPSTAIQGGVTEATWQPGGATEAAWQLGPVLGGLRMMTKAVTDFVEFQGTLLGREPRLAEVIESLEPALREYVDELEPPEESGGVRILTVHAAKGLEFPVVFVPGMAETRFPVTPRPRTPLLNEREGSWLGSHVRESTAAIDGSGAVAPLPWILDEVEFLKEEARLAYVAGTRARDLVVYSWADQYGGDDAARPSAFLQPLAGASGLQLGQLADGVVAFTDRSELHRPPSFHNQGQSVSEVEAGQFSNWMPWAAGSLSPAPDLHLSASSVTNFLACPRKFYYSKLVNLAHQSGMAAARGSAFHAAMQAFHDPATERRWRVLGEDVETVYDECCEKALQDYLALVDGGLEKRQEEQLLGRLFSHYRSERERWETLTTVATEARFTWTVEGRRVIGYIDRIVTDEDGEMRIIDYKTGGGKSKGDVERQLGMGEEGPKDLQLLIYFFALREGAEVFRGEDRIEGVDDVASIWLWFPKDLMKRPPGVRKVGLGDCSMPPDTHDGQYIDILDQHEELRAMVARTFEEAKSGEYAAEPRHEQYTCLSSWGTGCEYQWICPGRVSEPAGYEAGG